MRLRDMMKTRKRWLAVMLGAAIVVGGSIGVAAPANAAVVGVCTINVGEPHASVHVSGTIDSVGNATCTLGMPNIYVKTVMWRTNGTAAASGPTENYYDVTPYNKIQSVAWIPCAGNSGGVYQTSVSVVLQSPPGVNPAYHSNTYWSIWRNATCGSAFAASKNASDQTVTLTVLSDGTVQESVPAGIEVGEFIN